LKFAVVAPWKFSKSSCFWESFCFFKERVGLANQIQCVFPDRTLKNQLEMDAFLVNQSKILSKNKHLLIALDENGKGFNSNQLALLLESSLMQYSGIAFFCGGAYGLPSSLQTDLSVTLSAFTMPHELAYIVLMEQIYRATTILVKHPYHHGQPSSFIQRFKS
jgi:23S rRNA (pseudouridine1915-N3)-methyltransferase